MRSSDRRSGRDGAGRGGTPAGALPRRLSSEQLLGRDDLLVIEHRGREYRLRRTRNGKLILTT